jgi:hypothetical protein
MTRRDGQYFSAYGMIPKGATLQTCPQGHETCFPRNCPVCRAMAIPYEGGLSPEHKRAIGKGVQEAAEPKPPEMKIVVMGGRAWRAPVRRAA